MTKNEQAFYQEKANLPETSRGPLARQLAFLEERLTTLGPPLILKPPTIPPTRDLTTRVKSQQTPPAPLLAVQPEVRKQQKQINLQTWQSQWEAAAAPPTASNYLSPAPPTTALATWIPIGPSAVLRGQGGMSPQGIRPTMSGRVEDLEVAPGGKRVYVATANGGVWRSEDAGKSWRCLMENFDLNPTAQGSDTLSCGAIALVAGAAADKDRIYVGTGGTTLNGVGPLLSVDGGARWEVEVSQPDLAGQRFYALAVDPTNPQQVVAATSNGLYQRRPDGKGKFYWQATLEYVAGYGCYGKDVVAVQKQGVTTFYAVVMSYTNTWRTSVYASTDGNQWSVLDKNFPTNLTDGNGVLAVLPNNPQVVYALLGLGENKLPGLYRLEVNTGSWSPVEVAFPENARFKWYLEMAVDPNNINRLYLAGNTVYTEEGFCGEVYRCDVTESGGRFRAQATYIGLATHADAHGLVFAPGDSNKLWVVTDGGVFYSTKPTEDGYVFTACNTGLATLTTNHLGQHPTEDAILFCGTQDNGGLRFTGDEAWDYVSGGDSGYFVVNWYDPSKVLDTYTYNLVRRSTQAGERDSFWWDVKVPIEEGEVCLFYAPLAGTPYLPDLLLTNPELAKQAADTIAFGSERPWVSSDFGEHWQSIPTGTRSGDTLNARIRSLAFASATKLYVGTMNGGIYRFDKKGEKWQRTRLDKGLPPNFNLPVTDLAPLDENSIYITLGGTGDFRHVWYFDGNQWTARSGEAGKMALLDVQHSAIVVDPVATDHLYVGADIGVWRSTDRGQSWMPFSKGLPDAAVMDLRIHPTHRLLRAATFGRGVFELPLDEVQQPEVALYIRSTILDRGLYPTRDGLPDPTRPGEVVDHRNSPDIKLSCPDSEGTFPFPENINFEQFTNLLEDAKPSPSVKQVRVYVKVHNRGTKAANGVSVMLIASESESPLPTGFAGDVQDDDQLSSPNWTTLGIQKVNEVRAGFPKVVSFTIAANPNIHCLLALAYSPEDPFNATETNPHKLCFEERKAAMKIIFPMSESTRSVLQFDGRDDYVDLGNALSITGNQTLEMWIQPTSWEARQNPLAKAYGGEGTLTLEPNGTLTYYYGTSGDNAKPYQEFNTHRPLPIHQWSHLAIVRNFKAKTLTWYLNGEKVNEEPAQFTAAAASKLTTFLGKGYKNPFKGCLTEVRFWNQARSQLEIQLNFDHPLVGNEPGLVAYYPLNEGRGQSVLEIVKQERKSLSNCRWVTAAVPISPRPEIGNLILVFDGTNQVDLGNRPAFQMVGNQTLEMWIKPFNLDRRQNPFGKAYGGEGTITLETDGSLTYYYGPAGGNNSPYQGFSSKQAIPKNRWSHIAIVRDLTAKQLTWYLNGEPVNAEPAKYPAAKASNLAALLGKGYLANFTGQLTEVRFWSQARSAAAIKANYNRCLSGQESGLVAYYRLNEGRGETVINLVGQETCKIQGSHPWQVGDLPFR